MTIAIGSKFLNRISKIFGKFSHEVHPKSKREYHIDPKEVGRYREPNHVDVSRPKGYQGPPEKKRFKYADD